MIFIVAAIVVLVISFFLALVSLVREQNKVSGENSPSEPNPSPGTSRSFGDEVQEIKTKPPQHIESPLISPKLPHVETPDVVEDTKEAFPWEKTEGVASVVNEELEIERIKEELKRIGTGKKSQDKAELKEVPGTPDVQGPGEKRLSGEIFINKSQD